MTHLHGARSKPAPRLHSQRKRRTPGTTRRRGRAARPPKGARWSCSWRCSLGRGGLLRTENKRRSQKVSQRVLYRVTRTTVCSHSLSQRQQSCTKHWFKWVCAKKEGFYWFCMRVKYSDIIGFSKQVQRFFIENNLLGIFLYRCQWAIQISSSRQETALWLSYETESLNWPKTNSIVHSGSTTVPCEPN